MTASRKIAAAVYMSYETPDGGTTNQPTARTLQSGNSSIESMTLDGDWLRVTGRAHALDMLIPREHVLQLWVYRDD